MSMPFRVLLTPLLLAAATVVGSAWLSRLPLPAVPDLVMLIVLSAGIRRGLETGALLGAAGGYLRDLTSGGPLGLYTFVYVILGTAAGSTMTVVNLNQRWVPTAAAAAATGLVYLTSGAVVAMTGVATVQWMPLIQSMVAAAALNALLARPLDGLVCWVDRIARRRYPAKAIGYRVPRA